MTYLRLVHSYRDPLKGYPVQKVIHSFGKVDQLNRQELTRIATSILNYLNEADTHLSAGDPAIEWSKSYGTVHLVRELADRLKITSVIRSQLKRRRFTGAVGKGSFRDAPLALAILAMVINRLMEPSSKPAMVRSDWLEEDIYLPGSEGIKRHHLYRGLDFLEACKEALEAELFWQSRDLFQHKLEMVFYDTTSTYVEGAGAADLCQYGYSRDHRSDRKQVVIGLATDKEGLPITSCVFPGNTLDLLTRETMLKRLEPLDIENCMFVCDRGMVSEENLDKLEQGGYGYLVGVKLRQLKEVRDQVLTVRGPYRQVTDNLRVKEVRLGGKRYLICFNEQEAQRDRELREALLETLLGELEGVNAGQKSPCIIIHHATKKRLVRQLKTGQLVLNKGAMDRESRYAGKYVLRTSNRELGAAELAQQYKNLFRVERAFRTLQSGLDLRPLYHRVEHRIKAHVFLCILAYYIARYAEVKTGLTWEQIRQISRRLQAIKISLKNGHLIRTTKVSEQLQDIVTALDIKSPPQILG